MAVAREKDHWSAEVTSSSPGTYQRRVYTRIDHRRTDLRGEHEQAYEKAAGFVPQLTSTVISYLDVQTTDRILDLGCGDGELTARIAETAAAVVGLDSSRAMIEAARRRCGHLGNARFEVVDCRQLDGEFVNKGLVGGDGERFDKVFSNAALHWILRAQDTRSAVFSSVRELLQPRGLFVFEMGGHGNVADVHTALRAALLHRGLSRDKVHAACPWFFPSRELITTMLRDAGFEVERVETEWRPTKLTDVDDQGAGGLEGWIRLMGASFLDTLDDGTQKEEMVKEIGEVLEDVLRREEDGSVWMNYVRLRAVARRLCLDGDQGNHD